MGEKQNISVALVTLILWSSLDAALITNVVPATFDIGLAKELRVECWFSRDKNSALTFLTSLTLSHSKSTSEPNYTDLLSINNFDSQIYGDIQEIPGIRVSGAINNKNSSFLKIIWEYPKADMGGAYRCEANGINTMGKPVTESSKATVYSVNPDMKQFADRLQILMQQVEQLQSQVNETNTHNKKMDHENIQLSTLIKQLQTEMSSTKKQLTDLEQINDGQASRFSNVQMLLFTSSSAYNGKRYLLTKTQGFQNYLLSQLTCSLIGGYMAEIDTEDEYIFVRDNVVKTSSYSEVFISGTDEAQEGSWVHNYSKTQVKLLNWGPNEPNNGRLENCMAYYRAANWLYVDISCGTLTAFNSPTAFICEVPQ